MIRPALITFVVTHALAAQPLSFVTCPILRDTKTVPCWLAEYEGELYYLGVQDDPERSSALPQQSHELLVEAVVRPGPRVCGGLPLEIQATSVMPELTRSCNTVLPAKDGIEAPAGRTPAADATQVAETPVSPGYQPREFTVGFDFDSDQISVRSMEVVARAARWASTVHAANLRLTAGRGASLLSDGRVLTENEFIASRRSTRIAAALKGLGIAAISVDIAAENMPASRNGITGPASRRVVISVMP